MAAPTRDFYTLVNDGRNRRAPGSPTNFRYDPAGLFSDGINPVDHLCHPTSL